MHAYWITFDGRGPGCVEAESPERARELAAEITGKAVTACDVLPYPANPRLNKHEHKDYGVCPSFCYRPNS